mmetsp:Transcript_6098/g.10153  ORF Transcript_6098/g.10153 Transcript_6098/m.10153 type:complete len:115 (+) Transcript_6098:177-521(+)
MQKSLLEAVNPANVANKNDTPQQHAAAVSAAAAVGLVSATVFVDACAFSSIPLCESEAYMFSQLLTRRKSIASSHAPRGGDAEGGGGGSAAGLYVDMNLLPRIQRGDFLHAALV